MVFESGQFATILAMVSVGMGVSAVPAMAVQPQAGCKFIPISGKHSTRKVGIISSRNHYQSRAQRLLMEQMREACRPRVKWRTEAREGLSDRPLKPHEQRPPVLRALLPVRSGRHTRYPDQGAKQVEGLQIFAYVATFDRAFYQRADSSLNLRARTLIQLGGTADNRMQSWANDLFRRNVVDEQQHPGAQCFNGRQACREPILGCGQFFHLAPIDRFNQRIACRKVAIQSSRSHTCLFRNVVQAGALAPDRVNPSFAASRMRHTVALRVGARLS